MTHCLPACPPGLTHTPQVVYEIPSPGPVARLEMLKYHGRNKPVADDNLYYKVCVCHLGGV